MQDRYAGDIGDFGKFALLRAIQAQGLSVAVNWYRVEPPQFEIKKDGSFKQVDGKHPVPQVLFDGDRELAERLTNILNSEDRSVCALERADLIPGAKYYSEFVTVTGRDEWNKHAVEQLSGFDVVFLDPDNGLKAKSVGKGSARSLKYVFYEEVRKYIEQKQSVLVYNHRCRKPEKQYFYEICDQLHKETGVPESEILKITFHKCSVRDYFAVPATPEHRERICAAFESMEQSIWGPNGKQVCRIPE